MTSEASNLSANQTEKVAIPLREIRYTSLFKLCFLLNFSFWLFIALLGFLIALVAPAQITINDQPARSIAEALLFAPMVLIIGTLFSLFGALFSAFFLRLSALYLPLGQIYRRLKSTQS